jgi:CheY-like chemotaxis protein
MNILRPYILLVEDSKIARDAASAVLKELGCLVDIAEGGVKALRLVKRTQYDMIFIDLGLADVNGILIAEKIKAIEGAKEIPIVALTTYTDESLKEECFKIGMVGFIKKPLLAEKADYFLKKHIVRQDPL